MNMTTIAASAGFWTWEFWESPLQAIVQWATLGILGLIVGFLHKKREVWGKPLANVVKRHRRIIVETLFELMIVGSIANGIAAINYNHPAGKGFFWFGMFFSLFMRFYALNNLAYRIRLEQLEKAIAKINGDAPLKVEGESTSNAASVLSTLINHSILHSYPRKLRGLEYYNVFTTGLFAAIIIYSTILWRF